jgi:cephalosporin hydroxylase
MNATRMKSGNYYFQNSLKKTKYLGVNITKEVKDLYNENYKIMNNKIEEDTRR